MGEHDKIPESRWDYLFMAFPKPWTADTAAKRYARWAILTGAALVPLAIMFVITYWGLTWLFA